MRHNYLIRTVIIVLLITISTTIFGCGSAAEKMKEHLQLGNKYLQEGKYEEAILAFSKAIEIEPKNIEARIGLADAYIATDKYDEAERVLKEAVDIDKRIPEIYLKLADVYEKTNKDKEDITDLLKEGFKNSQDNSLKEKLDEIIVDPPKVTLMGGKYEEVQVIEFTNLKEGEEIYYTLDDTKPSKDTLKYIDPINIEEGTTILRAVVVNDRGYESKEIRNEYSIKINGNAAQIGNYIEFGSYYGKPILWRVINIDEDDSPMLFSENILTFKPFDAAESGKFDETGGSYSSDEDRQKHGSNKWENSNIREWLNSVDTKVKYSTQPPVSKAVHNTYSTNGNSNNAYAAEAGFLTNFTVKEQEAVKSETHKVLLSEIDKNEADGGNGIYQSGIVENYEKSYFKNIKDRVFLLSVKEFEEYVYKREYEYLGIPTREAAEKDETNFSHLDGIPNYYWVRTPEVSMSNGVHYIYGGSFHYLAAALSVGRRGAAGVRPALYLKYNMFKDGNGTKENPYKNVLKIGGDLTRSIENQGVKSQNEVITQNNLSEKKNTKELAKDIKLDLIKVSSVLKSQSNIKYSPENIDDWDNRTAWVEGKNGDGIGEWIYLSSNNDFYVKEINIGNGYQKSEEVYFKNNRPKDIKIEFSDGSSIEKTLKDSFGKNNKIILENDIITNYIKITILSIYKGSKYADTCISEIHVKGNEVKKSVAETSIKEDYKRGNTNGNIVNGGSVAYEGQWVYYCNKAHNGGLYKVKKDGTEKVKLKEGYFEYLNVLENWIYYVKTDNKGIYKIRIDGTDERKITDDIASYITVIDKWIYYSNNSDGGKIYKIKIDGTDKKKVNNEGASCINVMDEWIYYNGNGGICKIKKDGSNREKLINDDIWKVIVDNEWIYYKIRGEYGKLYKIKTDGTSKVKIIDQEEAGAQFGDSKAVNVLNNWIYYIDTLDNCRLYKIKTDGTNRLKLSNDWPTCWADECISLIDGWAIYSDIVEGSGGVYKVKVDGTDKQTLEEWGWSDF